MLFAARNSSNTALSLLVLTTYPLYFIYIVNNLVTRKDPTCKPPFSDRWRCGQAIVSNAASMGRQSKQEIRIAYLETMYSFSGIVLSLPMYGVDVCTRAHGNDKAE